MTNLPAVVVDRGLPAVADRGGPPDSLEVARMQRLWLNVLVAVLSDYENEADAGTYLASVDGRTVMSLAGVEPNDVNRLTLAPLRGRWGRGITKREAEGRAWWQRREHGELPAAGPRRRAP